MARTIYVDDECGADPRIEAAFQSALYAANSRSGNFRDSRGYRMLKEAAYAIQREDQSGRKVVTVEEGTRFVPETVFPMVKERK